MSLLHASTGDIQAPDILNSTIEDYTQNAAKHYRLHTSCTLHKTTPHSSATLSASSESQGAAERVNPFAQQAYKLLISEADAILARGDEFLPSGYNSPDHIRRSVFGDAAGFGESQKSLRRRFVFLPFIGSKLLFVFGQDDVYGK